MAVPRKKQTLTILSGAAVSDALYIGDGRLVAIQMPASWTTAALAFQGSNDGVTFGKLTDQTAEITSAAAALVIIQVNIYGPTWLKLVSGTNGSPTNQGADRSISVMVEKRHTGGLE